MSAKTFERDDPRGERGAWPARPAWQAAEAAIALHGRRRLGRGRGARTGNELAPAANAGHKKWNYNISEKVASLRIRYAQRDKLGQYGVIAVEEE